MKTFTRYWKCSVYKCSGTVAVQTAVASTPSVGFQSKPVIELTIHLSKFFFTQMSYRGSYQSRFVSASSSGSATSSVSDNVKRISTSSMNSVPPPQSLVTSSVPTLVGGVYMSAREREKKKEEEYANLMCYGAKTEKDARKKRIYDDELVQLF